ncbi:MAG: LysR family transcriptional regulator [Undibacterium sp.]|nr:LysR family transcriptional regulator [Undibacterium sp.]
MTKKITNNPANWDHYRAALAVLEEGSLSAAARALGMTQPTIGRQIEALEQSLGVTLFVRSQHGLSATESALALRPFAQNLKDTTAALERAIAAEAHEVRGTVRITASDVIGIEVLPAILAELKQAHPDLRIELVLSNKSQDLLSRDADIAVRMVAPKQDVLLSKRVGDISLGLYAHRSYLEKYGTPKDTDDLTSHSLIGFDTMLPYMRVLQEKFPFIQREKFSLRVDNNIAQLAAIRAGFGIGICQDLLAKRNPDLLHILPSAFRINFPTWIVMHEDLKQNQRYRTTFDFLGEGLRRYIGIDQ